MSKKLVQINVVCNGSTGRIMNQIQEEAINQGWEAYSFFGRGNPANDNCFKTNNKLDILFHVLITRLFDKHGHGSKRATKKLVKQIEEINPDVIQLHNIHGYYIHLKTLFDYLKRCNKKIVWTLHDCWPFTGHCSYFTYPKCEKWKKECRKCIRKKDYPKSMFVDSSTKAFDLKRQLFTGIKNLTIVTPSEWLANLVRQSFLKEYEIKVINNGIDLSVFKPTNTIDIRKKYNIPEDKKIILGVAAVWDKRKGLKDFIELSKIIDNSYIIVLVGLNKKQIKKLPNNMIGITRTENVEELANFYTTAEILYNPSKEETFSLVTAEAIACGTPIVAYEDTAMVEIIQQGEKVLSTDVNNKFGEIIKENDIKTVYNKIKYFKNYSKENYVEYSKKYNKENKYKEYIKIYER